MGRLVRYDVDGQGVATLTLDDPQTRNALSDELLDELLAGLDTAKHDSLVRAVVLTSSHERIFSSGGNLKSFADDRSTIVKYTGLDRFPRIFKAIGGLGKPVLCAANGDVLAGAFGLALACDLIVAKDTVQFGCPEINVGAFPFMISALIYRNVGRMKANELMFLGDTITADEARELGVVNKVVPAEQFDETVDDWARRLAQKSPLLLQLGKDAIDATRDHALPEALDYLQAQLALAFTTDDLHEGVRAFRERRDPIWTLS